MKRKARGEELLFFPRLPGAAVGSPPLSRPIWRQEGGGTPDPCVWGVNRVWIVVSGGGVFEGAAPARWRNKCPRSSLPLGVVLHGAEGFVGSSSPGGAAKALAAAPRGSFVPSAPSTLRWCLHQRGAARVSPGVVGVATSPASPWCFCSSGSVVPAVALASELLRDRMDVWSSPLEVYSGGGFASQLCSPSAVLLRAEVPASGGDFGSSACQVGACPPPTCHPRRQDLAVGEHLMRRHQRE